MAAALLALITALPTTLAAERIMILTQQSINFTGNMTLMVEDADPKEGKVWLSLYGSRGLLKSDIVGKGEMFGYDGVTRIELKVVDVYAGWDNDLVVMILYQGIRI